MKTASIPARIAIVTTIIVSVVVVNVGCERGKNSDHRAQIKKWGDDLDRKAGFIGAKKGCAIFDSLMGTLSPIGISDRVQYYKVMRAICYKDPSAHLKAAMYTDSLIQLFTSPDMQEKYPKDYSDVLLF